MNIYKIFQEKKNTNSKQVNDLFEIKIKFDKNSLEVFSSDNNKFQQNLINLLKISNAKKDFKQVMLYNALIETMKIFKTLLFYSNIKVIKKQNVRELYFYITKVKLLNILASYDLILSDNPTFKSFKEETLLLVNSVENYFYETFILNKIDI